jgi:hypothetical protein
MITLQADALADMTVAREREKKIAWAVSLGSQPATPEELARIRSERDDNRARADAHTYATDAARRAPVASAHSAPVDWQLREPALGGGAADGAAPSEAPVDVYPPPPASTFDPLSAASQFRWQPAPSDFFPNTKTLIDSRRFALHEFRQLCHAMLLRRRVESRLGQLEREFSMHATGKRAASPRDADPAAEPSDAAAQRAVAAGASAAATPEYLVLGGLYDALPNPACTAACALTRETKAQVERALNEEGARLLGAASAAAAATAGGAGGTAMGKAQQRARGGTKKAGASVAAGGTGAAKPLDASQSLASSQRAPGAGDGGGVDGASPGAAGGRGARVAGFSVSSNLQLLQPLRIDDLEEHAPMREREPFAFKLHRYPTFAFPRHDFAVSGPPNTPLCFPAGPAETAEAPSTAAATRSSSSSQPPAATSGGGGGGAAQRGPPLAGSRRALPSAAASEPATAVAAAGEATLAAESAAEFVARFALPRVSLETFEMPVVAHHTFRPPMALSSGTTPLGGAYDLPPNCCTRVAAAPLRAARPSPVPPRHQPLRVSTLELVFAPLPRTMRHADPADALSDDEDHELVGVDDGVSSRPVAPDGSGATLAAARQPPPQQQRSSATYLNAPPLSLDDALGAMGLLAPAPSSADTAPVPAPAPAGRPSSPTAAARAAAGGAAGRPPTPLRSGSPAPAARAATGAIATVPMTRRPAAERMAWTPQAVHAEDAFDTNDAVAAALRDVAAAAERRVAIVPAYMRHLV